MSTLEQTFEIQSTPDFFKKALWISLIFHGCLFLTVTVKNVFFNSEPLIYENAVRVDLVTLPDKLPPTVVPAEPAPPKPEEKKVEPKKEEKPEPKPEPKKAKPELVKKTPKVNDSINLDKIKKKESSAFEKLKQMEAMEKLKKATEAENRAKTSAKLFKGNQLSSGSELKGMSLLQHDNYVANVKRHIYNNWALPEWLAHKELKAQVIAKFDEHGNLVFKQIYKSSGNPSFDEVALEAVVKSSPVPAPPEALVRIVNNEGVLIGFPE